MSNHDNLRVVTRAGQSRRICGETSAHWPSCSSAALLSFRGGACVYQGEELGLTEADIAFEDLQDPFGIEFWPDFKGRDGCRTPMPWSSGLPNGGFSVAKPWLPVPLEHLPLAVDEQEKDPHSVLQMFRRFTAWRKQHVSLVTGDLALVQASESILAFERRGKGERVLCLFNFSNRSIAQPVAGQWQPMDGHGLDHSRFEDGTVALAPFGVWFGITGES